MKHRLFIGPVTKNTVDAVLELNRDDIAFIPSRRQVDYNCGYTGWTQETFRKYVGPNIYIERDHGGPGQGKASWVESLQEDKKYFDAIHVDPWKVVPTFEWGIIATDSIIRNIENDIDCEIGTEEGIYKFSESELILLYKNFSEIAKYAVVQLGTGLDLINEKNLAGERTSQTKIGVWVNLVKGLNMIPKDHNSDFLSPSEFRRRWDYRIAANVAPEFAIMENKIWLSYLRDSSIDWWATTIRKTEEWKKWFRDPDSVSSYDLCRVAGHYVQDSDVFYEITDNIDIHEKIKDAIKERICQILR